MDDEVGGFFPSCDIDEGGWGFPSSEDDGGFPSWEDAKECGGGASCDGRGDGVCSSEDMLACDNLH